MHRLEKKRRDDAFWRQFNEKPSIIPGCPGMRRLCVVQGYAWAEDKEHCEEYGRMLQADPSKVSQRAKKRGLPQVCHLHQFCILL